MGESVPKLRRKNARDWSKIDPTSLTAALGWDRLYTDADRAMQPDREDPMAKTFKPITLATKAGQRNSAPDQERIDTIAMLADEIGALASELGAAEPAGDPAEDAASASTEAKALSLSDVVSKVQMAVARLNDPVMRAWDGSGDLPGMYCAEDVEQDSVIIEYGEDRYYRASYTISPAGDVTIADRSSWEQVEEVYLPVDPSSPAATPIKSLADMAYAPGGAVKAIDPADPYTLRGLGVVFGGRDLTGDSFSAKTDYGLSRSLIGTPVYYDHTLRGIKSQIGTITNYEIKDDGIDVEIELDRHHKYIHQVLQLEGKKALRQSSGAVAHAVIREDGEIKRWIIGEFSLTPTPAEPRTTLTRASKAEPEAHAEAGGEPAQSVAELDMPIIILKRSKHRS